MLQKDLYTPEDYFHSFKEGERRGFDYFFDSHFKALVHFAYLIVKDTDTATDAVQDCFVKLWENRNDISYASGIKQYLYTSARNRCFDILRKQKNKFAYENHLKKTPEEFAPDDTQKIIISEAMQQIYLALQNLPEKYQRIFKMIYVEGKKIKDVAIELNLPVSTVKSQKLMVLQLLRKQLPHLGWFILFLNSYSNDPCNAHSVVNPLQHASAIKERVQ